MMKAVSGQGGVGAARSLLGDHAAESIQEAEADKSEGNRLFMTGKYEEAFEAYKRALDHFKDYPEPSLSEGARKFLSAVYSNSAQCLLKLPEIEDATSVGAVKMAARAMQLDPSNLKARYRRGLAHANAGDCSLARPDFEWVLRMEPANEAAKRELRALNARRRAEDGGGRAAREKAAAAAAVASVDDPRSRHSEAAAGEGTGAVSAAEAVQRQVAKAQAVKAAVQAYAESKGCAAAWERHLAASQAAAEVLSEGVLSKIDECLASGKALSSLFGAQGAALSAMDAEQRRTFLEADGFIAAIKQAHPQEFPTFAAAVAAAAPRKAPWPGGPGAAAAAAAAAAPAAAASEVLGKAVDARTLQALAEKGFASLELASQLSPAGLASLRGELEASDAAGVLKALGASAGGCRVGVVRNAVLQAHYQGSALLQVNNLLRGLAHEISRGCPLPEGDAGLRLAVPDHLQLVSVDADASFPKRKDVVAPNDAPCIWTACLLANPSWRPGDGGELRVHGSASGAAAPLASFEPRAGRLVIIDSRKHWFDFASVEGDCKLMCLLFRIPAAECR